MAVLKTLFSAVLNMSLTGAIVIAAVLLVRLVLRRMPAVFRYLLWSVVLLRLLCPVSFSSALSVFQVMDAPVTPQGRIVYLGQEGARPGETVPVGMLPEKMISAAAGADGAAVQRRMPLVEERHPGADFGRTGAFVWLLGVAALWGYSAVSMVRLKKRLVGAAPEGDNIYGCDYIGTAFVLGVIRPRIYLPTTLTGTEREYILLHERTHIRRGDHLLRLLAFLALSVHWFNPLVWCAFFLSERDMEMSCDEAVMQEMGVGLRAAYSASLLTMASGRKVFAGAPLGFGEGNVKCRIKNLMRYKKTAVFIAAPVLAVIILVVIALGSNPQSGLETDKTEPSKAAVSGTDPDAASRLADAAAEGGSADIAEEALPDGAKAVPITKPVVTEETVFGADGPILDYGDEDRLIFHDYFGLFVYNVRENLLEGAVDLAAIGCQYTQGDAYCEVAVPKDGRAVYLHANNAEEMYVYNTAEAKLFQQAYDSGYFDDGGSGELFFKLKPTGNCVDPDYTVLRSSNCVTLPGSFLYLESGSGMVSDLYYIVERDKERVQFAWIFEELFEEDAEQSPFGYGDYTGYMDECVRWSGYKQFVHQDYDGDGTVDRVWRENLSDYESCRYRIEFGNGDRLKTRQMGSGMPEIQTCDLDGDGVREILFGQSYGFSTDPNAFGETALFKRGNNGYEALMPPEELCTYMSGAIPELQGGIDYYTPAITLLYKKLANQKMQVSVRELTGAAALTEEVSLNASLNDYLGQSFNTPNAEQEYCPVSYKTVVVNDGGRDILEYHFEVFFKWSPDEIVVTAAYENGALRVVGSRYEHMDDAVQAAVYYTDFDISPEDAEVMPAVQELDFETKIWQYEDDAWYRVVQDGVEYMYGTNPSEGEYVFSSWALRDGSHVLANGLRVGMTEDEALLICPSMVRIGFGGEGYPAWNGKCYPPAWTDEFDYMLVANIEDNEDNLPEFLGLMIKNREVRAITKYKPTAG